MANKLLIPDDISRSGIHQVRHTIERSRVAAGCAKLIHIYLQIRILYPYNLALISGLSKA